MTIVVLSAFLPHILAGKNLFLEVIEDPNNLFSFYPWNMFSASIYHNGRFPLYNPFNAFGVPLLANLQSAPFYPLHLLLFLCPTLSAFDVFLILRFLLLGVGMYIFSRKIGLSHQSALVAMICAVFSGFFIRYRSMVHLNVEILLPWALWMVSRISANLNWKNFILLTIILSASLLGGNIESSFFLFLCATFWAFWLVLFEDVRDLSAIACTIITSFLIASVQILPFLEYLPHAWHIHEAGAGEQWLDMRFSIGFLTPLLFPIKMGMPTYVGATTISLALVGVSYNKKSLFFLFTAFFFLCLIYGIPGFKWLTYLPIFNRVASYKYGLAPLTIAIAILAAFGAEALKNEIVSPIRYSRSAFVVLSFALFFVLGAHIVQAQVNYDGLVFILMLLLLSCVLAFFSPLRAGISALVWIELVVYFMTTPTKTLLNSELIDSPTLQYLSKRKNEGRIASSLGSGFPPNLNLLWGIHEVGLFDALYPRNYLRVMSEALSFEIENAEKFFKEHAYQFPIHEGSTSSPLWNELGVKFFVGRDLAITSKKESPEGVWENEFPNPLVEIDGAPLPPITSDFWSFTPFSNFPSGKILFRYNYLPGWRCWVGKHEVKIEKNTYGFMEINTTYQKPIVCRYVPWSFRIALWTTITTLLTISIITIL